RRDGPAVEALDQVEGPDGHAHPGAGEADPLGQGEGLDDGAGLVFDGVDDLHLPLDGELDGAVAGDGGVADLRVDHPAVHHPGGDAGEAGEGDGGALAHGALIVHLLHHDALPLEGFLTPGHGCDGGHHLLGLALPVGEGGALDTLSHERFPPFHLPGAQETAPLGQYILLGRCWGGATSARVARGLVRRDQAPLDAEGRRSRGHKGPGAGESLRLERAGDVACRRFLSGVARPGGGFPPGSSPWSSWPFWPRRRRPRWPNGPPSTGAPGGSKSGSSSGACRSGATTGGPSTASSATAPPRRSAASKPATASGWTGSSD